MQHIIPCLSLFSLAALVATAPAEASAEAACEQLRAALGRELAAVESVQDAASAAAALPQLKAVLDELALMDRSHEAEKALWEYIDNTPGVKVPLIELLHRLTIEFTRLELASFFGCAQLGELLAPQLQAPKKEDAAG